MISNIYKTLTVCFTSSFCRPSSSAKLNVSSPGRPCIYRTPDLSKRRGVEKVAYIQSTSSSPAFPSSSFILMQEGSTCNRFKPYTEMCKKDDGSDTSNTTDSREDIKRHVTNEFEVEVVSIETSKGAVAQTRVVVDTNHIGHGSDLTSNEETVPDRQKSAMQAFLANPNGLNWDDLVRSMREEMYIKTITIKPSNSDDSSSIGSLGSSTGDNKSAGSMNSSLSSKSAFLKRSRRDSGKVNTGSGRRTKKNETLEKKVERVLYSGNPMKTHYQDESNPFQPKSKIVAPHPIEVSSPNEAGMPSPKLQVNSVTANTAKATSVEDPPLMLKLSISADSDEDSFYFHIRGRPSPKTSSPPSRSKFGSSFKSKVKKNPYAFSNHRLLPAVVEEGNIQPFPTTFDELDNDEDIVIRNEDQVVEQGEAKEPVGEALGSFAASIGKVEPASSITCLQMYMTPNKSRGKRKRSILRILSLCRTRTKAEI